MAKSNGKSGRPHDGEDIAVLLLERDCYTVRQARERLGGLSQEMIYKSIRSGELKTFLIGALRMISPEAIKAYVRKRESEPAPLRKSTRRKNPNDQTVPGTRAGTNDGRKQ